MDPQSQDLLVGRIGIRQEEASQAGGAHKEWEAQPLAPGRSEINGNTIDPLFQGTSDLIARVVKDGLHPLVLPQNLSRKA